MLKLGSPRTTPMGFSGVNNDEDEAESVQLMHQQAWLLFIRKKIKPIHEQQGIDINNFRLK